MRRHVTRLIWLTTMLLPSCQWADGATAAAELDFAAAPSIGLQLHLATVQSWTAALSLNNKDSRAEAEPAAAVIENTNQQRPPFPWRTVPPERPDYRGAARDTAYFMVFQLAVIGLLYVAPESVSGWTDEDKEDYNSNKWQENIKNPQRDTDDFIINYVLHPYWGATYYIRGRERGFSRTQSFFFSFGLSFLYEFGFESLFENPSYQDLWTTPVLGSLIGELWFTGVRDRIKAKPGELNWKDKTVLFLTDPLGVASAATDRFFGIDSEFSLAPVQSAGSLPTEGGAGFARNSLKLVPTTPGWGIQFQLKW